MIYMKTTKSTFLAVFTSVSMLLQLNFQIKISVLILKLYSLQNKHIKLRNRSVNASRLSTSLVYLYSLNCIISLLY